MTFACAFPLLLLAAPAAPAAAGEIPGQEPLSVRDILQLPVPPADHRVAYGPDAAQFGELRLPKGAGPHPVAIVIHGGCWRSEYSLGHISSLCGALTDAGVATWSLEYRRLGNPGGGWTGTFDDVARGADHLRQLARVYPLDVKRVVAVGHSAGGHLALWLAARRRLPREGLLYAPEPLTLAGVVALAGVPDLRRAAEDFQVCGGAITQLLGAAPREVPERVRAASPLELLPLGVPQRLIQGALDRIVPPELARAYVDAARRRGDDAQLELLDDAGHFELIAPASRAWSSVRAAVLALTSSATR